MEHQVQQEVHKEEEKHTAINPQPEREAKEVTVVKEIPTPQQIHTQPGTKPPTPFKDSQQDLHQKIKTLENKVTYYETEHEHFQNKLLLQRQSFEEEKLQLQEIVKQYQSLQSEAQRDEVLEELDRLRDQVILLTQENAALQQSNTLLTQQNEFIPQVPELPELQLASMVWEIDIQNALSRQQSSTSEDKLAKLQKKVVQFEQYLEEKDKTLLEQETQLTELQDQCHELLKTEDALKGEVKVKGNKIEELMRDLKLLKDQMEYKIADMMWQLTAKDQSLSDAWQLASEKELEIRKQCELVKDAEEAVREMRGKVMDFEEDNKQCQQQVQEVMEEGEQLKHDFQQVLNFKNELEMLIEEQTQHIEQKNKKLHMLEETLRYKEAELEKKDSLLRRMSAGADDMKKKLSQAEMKIRQVTQTTIRDMKGKMKDQGNEIEVLKEMVKSANKTAKAKDIDIQRLSKKIQRLEKMTELNKGMLPQEAMRDMSMHEGVIEEQNEQFETDTYTTPLRVRNDLLGLNPANYSVEEEVQQDLLHAQHNRSYNISNRASVKKSTMPMNYKQREYEEALELDRMLEAERRNLSQDVFQKKYDEKFDSYFNNINVPNFKNQSSGVRGLIGGADGDTTRNDSRYEGLLPNLNLSKKEQLEQELMMEINESMRKDKFMTPNLQGKAKVVNKLNAAAYGKQNQANAPYFHERNKQMNKKML